MELRLQPKPEVEVLPANQGIVSREQYFVKKKFEKINEYFFPALLIRNWRPKAELLYPTVSDETAIQYECDFNRDVQSCFVEDNAEEVFLRTPPPCFVVIGKLGASVSKVGRQLAQEFGSVLIQADEIIGQLLQTETETAKTLDRLLRLGVSLTLNFVLALLSYAAHTAEARHRGYVLCGLPCIPEDLDLPAEQQFNYLFTWDNKPTVFINVLFEDEDLIKERTGTRYEIKSFGPQTCIFFHPEKRAESEDDGEDDPDEEQQPEKEEPQSWECDIDVSPSQACVQLPRDEEPQVWSELELFDNKVRPAIQLLISRVDPQYFITVDSRLPNEIDIVLARLSLLQVWKVPTAFPFIPPKPQIAASDKNESEENMAEETEEGAGSTGDLDVDPDIKLAAEESPQTAFLTLFAKKNISPKYRWELSHYNYVCPVSLREGELVQGKSEFAVVFMKYIYFLRSQAAMMKFIQNPRAYVLPIRPDPLTKFIIVGYPYAGKTTLASQLTLQFDIPLINVDTILKNDLDRKKSIYQEFCRQKAECRESIRLNAEAWQEWRMEEEHRICLIEEWVCYIQSLLSQRIEQFYSLGETDEGSGGSGKEMMMQAYSPQDSHENIRTMSEGSSEENAGQGRMDLSLAVCGVAMSAAGGEQAPRDSPSPSNKIMKAMKHEDFNFNEPHLEVEANLFFSSLWNTFSNEDRGSSSGSTSKREELGEEWGGEMALPVVVQESYTVDWCSLLPPQSLSSFLMSRIPYTTREKRRSFKVFLEAASKAYWTPSKLKTEFAKWRLPCYMDIPLCEIFLDNPILLLKYTPEWLKERPLIPDPVDPMHPSVVGAGQVAFERAAVVSIKQNKEEVAVLIRDAVEKAEREGMRVTGEVVSPGGWVLDNMVLDLDIWKKLACEGVMADHVYILQDTEPEHVRIINTWCELNETSFSDLDDSEKEDGDEKEKEKEEKEEEEEEEEEEDEEEGGTKEAEKLPGTKSKSKLKEKSTDSLEENVLDLLEEALRAAANEDCDLDEIFEKLLGDLEEYKNYIPPVSVDLFSHHIFENTIGTWFELKEESVNEEAIIAVQSFSHNSTSNFFRKTSLTSQPPDIPLGHPLQKFTNGLLNAFKRKQAQPEKKIPLKQSLRDSLQFFISLLTLPGKLENLKNWLVSIDRGETIEEYDVFMKSQLQLISTIRKNLQRDFVKKPRELEAFEVEEIIQSERRDKKNKLGNWDEETEFEEDEEEEEEEEEDGEGEGEEEEDVRIFGESGPLCVVNLERNIFLIGKREFALRYYGKLYYFWNETSKNKFILNPEKYAPYYSVIRCYPPLRIFVTGPHGSGKTTLASSIANQFTLTHVDFGEFIIKKLVPHMHTTYEQFNSLGDPKLLLSQDYNAAAREVREKFRNAPYIIQKFWMENPVYEYDIDTKINYKKKLIDLRQPIISKNFPELTYECIDSVPEKPDDEDAHLKQSSRTQEPYVSMKGLEAILRSYFESTAELTEYCVDKVCKLFWTKEPFLTHGVVLENFPLRFSDVGYTIENNWLPDLVYEMSLPEDKIIERNINNLMDLWDSQLKLEMVEERTLEDTLVSIQDLNKRARRKELLAEKQSATAEEMAEQEEWGSKWSAVSDERVSEEIEAALREEFPPLSFNPVFETYEAGRARISDNLLKCYRRDSAEIEKIRAVFKSKGIPWRKIDSLKKASENQINVSLLLDKMRRREKCKGEFAFAVKMEVAEQLLQEGFYFLSKFGRWCPVQVYRMRNPIHMFRPLSSKGKVTPIVYRNYIYFVGGKSEKEKFIQDPVKYTFNEPHHPNIPLRVAVIGPPKSGKSTLSNRLGRTFDMKVVTMGGALRFVLEKMPKSTLAKSINNYLRRGCFLPLSFKVEALVACLNDPACVTQGFVFDGIPFNAALTQSLAERGKLPFVIISLVGEADFGKSNREKLDLKEFRLPYKNRIDLDSRYKDWQETYKRFAQWNHHTYNNLYEVNAKLSVVDIFYQAYDIIRKSFFAILYYVEYCVSSRVLPLQYLCVGQHEYELRKSPFQNNCPVCWVEDNKLSITANPPPRSGLVQYLEYFYWICQNHMIKFTQNPKIYVLPLAPHPPALLPKIISLPAFKALGRSLKIHGHGRCPVTRVDFPAVLDWEGSWNHAVLYDNRVYLCKSKEMLDRFLTKPWRYCKANTEFESERSSKSNAVEQLGPPKVTSLPPIGFLEQTVAEVIHKALQILGSIRPLYPNMNPTTTGCTFLGLYLKLLNNSGKSIRLEKQYFQFMLENCKAHLFQVPPYKRPKFEEGQGDFEVNWEVLADSDDSDSVGNTFAQRSLSAENLSGQVDQTGWLDLEAQADKKMWSAQAMSSEGKYKMMLTSDDELLEIPEVPKVQVVLKYETHILRSNPLPPVPNCLTFIYSVAPPLTVPEKFNYRTLYQPVPTFSSPYPTSIRFNPEKEFDQTLVEKSNSDPASQPNIWKGRRTYSNETIVRAKSPSNVDTNLKLMTEKFIPRFQLLANMPSTKIPQVPEVVEEDPLIFNPHRDYAHTLLLSNFFLNSHVLRCYEWNQDYQLLEFSSILEKNPGLSDVQVEYFSSPHRAPSVSSRKTFDSYRDIFVAASTFVSPPEVQEPQPIQEFSLKKMKSSLLNFMHAIILEKLDEIFSNLTVSSLSSDYFDISVVLNENEANEKQPAIHIREILPYPPLPWDILSRPYYSYTCAPTVFRPPMFDDIAHERHFSLLDGIREPNDEIKFVRYPVRTQQTPKKKPETGKQIGQNKSLTRTHDRSRGLHVFFDFFNLKWTSFLTYPFSWSCNLDVKGHFCGFHNNAESPICATDL